MSVINKMLRDLDQRHAGRPGSPEMLLPVASARQGTVPVKVLQQRPHHATRQRAVWSVMLIALVAVGWWFVQSGQRSTTPSVQTALVQVAPLAAVPASVPKNVAIATSETPKPLTVAPKVATKAVAVKQMAPAVAKPLPRAEPQVTAVVPDTAAGTLRMESSLMRLPLSKKAAQLSAVPPQAPATPQAVLARPAAMDALAQAQGLWNAGSHMAAIELLGQALNRVESSTASGTTVAAQSPLASLARELARMQLADGQVGQALALLKRLEPQLAQVPDVWAMRGNAAQRLGQHAEAAQSYQKALALRPDEPRWMLGAAVSLAAQGQTAAAGELADKARVMGALRPEVASYLRQLGVIIRTD